MLSTNDVVLELSAGHFLSLHHSPYLHLDSHNPDDKIIDVGIIVSLGGTPHCLTAFGQLFNIKSGNSFLTLNLISNLMKGSGDIPKLVVSHTKI